jgi:hypothetical protein
MPSRPLVRVSVLHFYEMVNGPVYHESDISVLAVHEGVPGWFVLKMPVTDGEACAGGRNALGTPKVMRRVTLERASERYVGTSYARDGVAREFTLTLDVGDRGGSTRGAAVRIPVLRGNLSVARASPPRRRPTRVDTRPGARGAGVWKIRSARAGSNFPR